MCYSKFRSSDGRGGEGDLGDCGYYDPADAPLDCATAVPVWGSDSALCSGERARCGTMVARVGALVMGYNYSSIRVQWSPPLPLQLTTEQRLVAVPC